MDKTDHDLNTFFALIFHEISLSALGFQSSINADHKWVLFLLSKIELAAC